MTVSFSNTAVFNVPLILAFSTSKNPPLSAVNLNPLPATLVANWFDSIVPVLNIVISPPVKLVAPNVQPPIVPDSAFNTPAFVTLNGADAKAALPKCIPSPDANFIVLAPEPPVKSLAFIVNPPTVPPASAVIVPCKITSPSGCK